MELGGKVTIVCEKTRYSADIEFRLKVGSMLDASTTTIDRCSQPFIGGQDLSNYIEGKIRLEDDVMYRFSGRWDDEITLTDAATNVSRRNLDHHHVPLLLNRYKPSSGKSRPQ